MGNSGRVTVSNVRVLERGRKERASSSVFCPKDRARRPLAGCFGCPEKLEVTAQGKEHWVDCKLAFAPPPPRSPADAPVSEHMTAGVVCVAPDLPVAELVLLLVEQRLTGAPVVSEQNLVIGVVSQSDLVRQRYDEAGAWVDAEGRTPPPPVRSAAVDTAIGSTVAGVMSAAPRVLRETDTLRQAGRVMAQERVHRLPIVDERGAPVGILSTLDLARFVGHAD